MKIGNALKVAKLNILAEIAGIKGIKTTTFMGKPGIGKTEMTRHMAQEMDMLFYHVSAPEMSIEQLTGLPDFEKMDEKYREYSISELQNIKGTAWTCPEVIATANKKALDEGYKGCIILLDDIHETPLSTIPYFYQLLNEKKVSGWALDKRVHIICAMNDSSSANFNGLPSPIINRMSILEVEADPDAFLDGYGINFNYLIRSFLKSHTQFLNEAESMVSPFGTPRSWTLFNNSFEYYIEHDKEWTLEHLQDIAGGSASNSAAMELNKHVEYLERMSLDKYVKERKIVDVTTLPALDQILLGYIVNFIYTLEDGQYLAELMDKNIDNMTFVGFCASEIYLKYKSFLYEGKTAPLGIKLFLEKGCGIDVGGEEAYGELTAEDRKIIDNFKIKEEDKFFEMVMPYVQ